MVGAPPPCEGELEREREGGGEGGGGGGLGGRGGGPRRKQNHGRERSDDTGGRQLPPQLKFSGPAKRRT